MGFSHNIERSQTVCEHERRPHNTPGKIFAVDLYSKSTSLIWSGIASDVFVSPQGQPFIISHEPRPENAPEGISYVGLIDTLSDVIAFVDTLNIRDNGFNYQSIVFDKNRPLFYAVDNARRLFAYDYDQKKSGVIMTIFLIHCK